MITTTFQRTYPRLTNRNRAPALLVRINPRPRQSETLTAIRPPPQRKIWPPNTSIESVRLRIEEPRVDFENLPHECYFVRPTYSNRNLIGQSWRHSRMAYRQNIRRFLRDFEWVFDDDTVFCQPNRA